MNVCFVEQTMYTRTLGVMLNEQSSIRVSLGITFCHHYVITVNWHHYNGMCIKPPTAVECLNEEDASHLAATMMFVALHTAEICSAYNDSGIKIK